MNEVLYRKYRPKTFSEVVGQDAVKTILKNALSGGRISHAYLFAGQRGVGKTTIARVLAKAVNCLAPMAGEPDGSCQNCVLIQEGRFIDLIEIDAASYTGVDNIREIVDHVKFSPSFGKYKVFIIDEVHMLSKAAFNALLKTLEEPPAHAVFILATTEIQKVPSTIISRSQRFDFRPISESNIRNLLQKVALDEKAKIEPEALRLVARSAEGSVRDALSLLDQLISRGSGQISQTEVEEILGLVRVESSQNFLDFFIKSEEAKAAEFVRTLTAEGQDPVLFIRNFLEYLRLILYSKIGIQKPHDLSLSEEEAMRLAGQAANLESTRVLALIKLFLESYRETKTSPIPELSIISQIFAFPQKAAAKIKPGPEGLPESSTTGIDLGMIVDRWAQVLTRVKDYNHSLLASLRLGRIVKLEGLDLTLAFPYNFHKDTIEARKNRIIIEQVLEDVFASPLRLKIHLERELTDGQKEGELLREAMKVLGNDESEFGN